MSQEHEREAAPWYAPGLRFECRRCGRCCRGAPGYVWVTNGTLRQIAVFLSMDAAALRATAVRRVGAHLSLLERPNGDCIFYADGCLVYPVRPAQCWTFPFWPEHVATRARWERLGARECCGVDRGRLWTTGEIDLLARRWRGEPADPDLARAFDGLKALYAELDAEIGSAAAACRACGRCCDFTTHEHVLYVTELERAFLKAHCGAGDAAAPPGRCPHQAGAVCAARDVRPLGCRTFFCDAAVGGRGRELHEAFHRRLAPLREASGLTLSYAPFLGR